ncbi:hypothetical protein QJS04_geneDACA000726 [Acorus gramineus]|uniref:Uncharacterized protein n=1 Tax=Acorus gramineus TaxID=55184 RepID=A0AAV9APJ0_ACOGR|nr:hypothetical protein QJS04_geneDACA000726 [Acorus gramineus]
MARCPRPSIVRFGPWFKAFNVSEREGARQSSCEMEWYEKVKCFFDEEEILIERE